MKITKIKDQTFRNKKALSVDIPSYSIPSVLTFAFHKEIKDLGFTCIPSKDVAYYTCETVDGWFVVFPKNTSLNYLLNLSSQHKVRHQDNTNKRMFIYEFKV